MTRSWYTGCWWVGCYIWYGRAAAPPSPLLAVPNVTAYPSTASVPITVLLCNGPLLCGFNVAIKGLKARYSLVADVGPSVVRPVVTTKTKQDRLDLRNSIQKWHCRFGCRIQIHTSPWVLTISPFSGKHGWGQLFIAVTIFLFT